MACDLGLASWLFSHPGMLGSRAEWSHGAEHAERAEAAPQTDLARALPKILPAHDPSYQQPLWTWACLLNSSLSVNLVYSHFVESPPAYAGSLPSLALD